MGRLAVPSEILGAAYTQKRAKEVNPIDEMRVPCCQARLRGSYLGAFRNQMVISKGPIYFQRLTDVRDVTEHDHYHSPCIRFRLSFVWGGAWSEIESANAMECVS